MQKMNNLYALHKHLDECRQCMNNPFDLCPIGNELILLAVLFPNNSYDVNADAESNAIHLRFIHETRRQS